MSHVYPADLAAVAWKKWRELETASDPGPCITRAHALPDQRASFEVINIDGVGTRHRSAYRLCAHEPGVLAIVVSQDGGVQFVKSLGGAVTVWEHGQLI